MRIRLAEERREPLIAAIRDFFADQLDQGQARCTFPGPDLFSADVHRLCRQDWTPQVAESLNWRQKFKSEDWGRNSSACTPSFQGLATMVSVITTLPGWLPCPRLRTR